MTSPQTKTNLVPWQWALIGSGSTLILVLAGFGLWNLVTSKSPSNSSVSQNSGQPALNSTNTLASVASKSPSNSSVSQNSEQSALNSANTVASNDTIKRLLGRWQKTGEISMIFTPEGKAFMFASNQAGEYRYQVNDQTQPKQLLLSDSIGVSQTATINFEFTSDGQLQLNVFGNAVLLQKVSDMVSLPSEITVIEKQPLAKQLNGVHKAKQSEAKTYIGSMNRAQQAFFLENNQFTSDLDKLQIGMKSSTENYAYSIVAIDDKRIVQNVGLAKAEGLKSYTGIAFVKKNASNGETITLAKLCESIQPTREMPPQPKLSGDDMQCPAGYVDLNRN
ncbi:hypothetical protein GTQ43_03615 [Nostoc sp. KVJ3]|uniref:type IV pilin-like G/H family protein n=1 Tax=Nostoc sp. KVJ3 TaxID=457945 RepID=UPI0022388DAA|nr:type IV pilin-like G/H family protein [Nostoc sp. KVJ3]MCW5312969.1 hypothetical protein [Nostoc sp. KVJ3]